MVYYHHTDHLGTTEVITDSNGKIVWHADYEAFGSVMNERGEENFTPNYTGKFFDESSGLYYFNARWYDCELGRFTTQDPARDGVNWWIYCGGNPITFVDPDGREIREAEQTQIQGAPENVNISLGNTDKETIASAGCTLLEYTRIASTLSGEIITAKEANQFAKENNLFSGKDSNELSIDSGITLINGLLSQKGIIGITVSLEESIFSSDEKLEEKLNSYQRSPEQFFANARISTTNKAGTEKYGHSLNLSANPVRKDSSTNKTNIYFNDTSGVRTKLNNDVRHNELNRIDIIKVNRTLIY